MLHQKLRLLVLFIVEAAGLCAKKAQNNKNLVVRDKDLKTGKMTFLPSHEMNVRSTYA
jgi:hypothetical protein